MAFLLLHVINQQLKPRNNLPFSCSLRQWIDMFVIAVHHTHILVHPRMHDAHRLKSAGSDCHVTMTMRTGDTMQRVKLQ